MKVIIGTKEYAYFSAYGIELNYASIASTFSLKGLKNIIEQPFGYEDCKVYDDGGNLLITGTIINTAYTDMATVNEADFSGYSVAGVLEDCTIPVDLYPLQSDNLSLKQICDKLIGGFGLEYSFTENVTTEMNKKYSKSVAGESQSVKEYLNSLASQRGLIMTHDATGRIIFTRIEINKMLPVFIFDDGNGQVEMQLQTNGQSMHSEITVFKQASKDNPDTGQYTIKNPYVSKYRPTIKVMTSGDIFDVKKAARLALSAELQTIKLIIKTKKFISPGQIIQVKNEALNINLLTSFFVESTSIIGDTKGEKYTLTCSLPDVYSDNEVKSIFV